MKTTQEMLLELIAEKRELDLTVEELVKKMVERKCSDESIECFYILVRTNDQIIESLLHTIRRYPVATAIREILEENNQCF